MTIQRDYPKKERDLSCSGKKDSYLENYKLLSSFFLPFPKTTDDTDKEQQRAAVSA